MPVPDALIPKLAEQVSAKFPEFDKVATSLTDYVLYKIVDNEPVQAGFVQTNSTDLRVVFSLYSATGSVYVYFGLLLLASKLIKPLPPLLRCKRDILYIPIGILFGYYSGFISLWALATAYNKHLVGQPRSEGCEPASSCR